MSDAIEFEWDEANTKHLAAHKVTPLEFEQAMTIDPEDVGWEVVDDEQRYQAVGPTKAGRLLYLVWTPRRQKVRAITAYDAPKRLKKQWQATKR